MPAAFKMNKVAIIDFESGNLFSVFHACKLLGLDPVITHDETEVLTADGVILPGVGAFADAMQHLEKSGMTQAITTYIETGKPFLGICLGLQLLLDESEEFGETKGLGLIRGKVRKFQFESNVKIPHVGWSKLQKAGQSWSKTLFSQLHDGDYMYFVHSFYADPFDKEDIIASAEYEGKTFCAAIRKNNIFATQFHPEKSGTCGLKILESFAVEVKNGN